MSVAGRTVVFIGFMGAGKSTAARSVADIVGHSDDIDRVIEVKTGERVRDYFDQHGESNFRRVEEEVAKDLLSDPSRDAIALGGGSVLSESIRGALRDHIVVWLDVDAETAWRRVAKSERPLVAKGEENFRFLYEERRPLYEELADVVLPRGDPGLAARAMPWIQQLEKLPPRTKMLWATSSSGEYPVYVGPGLLSVDWWPVEGRRFCVSDHEVARLYADRIQPVEGLIEVSPGEQAKSLTEAERILDELAQSGMRRDDHVVALGGGVIGDLAGFCAHVYQRGVQVVHVPTTLVAQVDSAYGGKTGVDLPNRKNYVGGYQQPVAVITDTSTLATLPSYELGSGFVEALKTGLLAGGRLWDAARSIEKLDPEQLTDLVFACAQFKCEVVAEDERDSGRRQILNLGHTIGHAIEAASEYEHHAHGEAIGLGLLAVLRLSGASDLRDEVEGILRRFALPTTFDAEALQVDAVVEALEHDKKRTARGIEFVLLSEPGKPEPGQLLDRGDVRAAIEELAK